MKEQKTLCLLDAHAIIHRAYHALPDFTTQSGEPTGALYGIVAMLVNIFKDIKPDYIVACYDLPEPTFRHEVYDAYKAGRKKADDALVAQIIRSKDIFKHFGIPIYEHAGYEADDILGTIVEQVSGDDSVRVVIASGDMDTLQLVRGDAVRVYTLGRGLKDVVTYNEGAVRARFGFGPELLPDYKGLRGDPSDNIPGVQGVGEKTATELIVRFGNLDAIYAALERYTPSGDKNEIKENTGLTPRILGIMLEHKDEAYFSKMLATIKRDAPIQFSLPEAPWRELCDVDSVLNLLMELELRSLIPRVRELLTGSDTKESVAHNTMNKELPQEHDIARVGLMLWLIKSDITNPTYDDIMQFTGTKSLSEAEQALTELLKERSLDVVWERIEHPLMPVIERLNNTGVLLDTAYLQALSEEYHSDLAVLEEEIFTIAGREFNIRSPKQLGEALFNQTDGLGLKSSKKTASGQYATSEKELKKLVGKHPIIDKIFAYRELQKLLSTYVDNLPKLVHDDGRLYTTFLQAGTTTGRISSHNPNMQNIPTKTAHGRRVRNAFIAPEGSVLVALDYSQIELRVAAILSGDKRMREVFVGGGDIHSAVALAVFGVAESEVTPEMRRRAKVINFGILYGMGVNVLRANLQEGAEEGVEISTKEAKEYLNAYFEQFNGLATWIDRTKSDAARLGYTQTLFGRRRYFEGLQSKVPYIRAGAERMAINAPIQGTAADIIKLAMVRTDAYIEENNLRDVAKLTLQVHDELIYEMREDMWRQVADKIRDIMEQVLNEHDTHGIPLVADIKHGPNWGEML